MSRPAPELRLYATEAAARRAGTELCGDLSHHVIYHLYRVLPVGEKPVYLLSKGQQLLKAERTWIAERQAMVTKLGRYQTGISYMPVQRNMIRQKRNQAEHQDSVPEQTG